MKKLFIILLAILCLPSVVFAKEFGLKEFNYNNNLEFFLGVTEDTDGGYISVGIEYENLLIVKYDKNDKVVWERVPEIFGLPFDVELDKNGNIYISMIIYGDSNVEYGTKGAVLKFDKNGSFLKKYVIDANERWYESAFFDLEVKDDTIVAVGNRCVYLPGVGTDEDEYTEPCSAYSVVLDTNLNEKKRNSWNYNDTEQFWGVTLTSDGGYVAVGYTFSTNVPGFNYKFKKEVPFIVKYNKNYELEWQSQYEVDPALTEDTVCNYGSDSMFFDVIETCDGNYTVAGSVPKLTSTQDFEMANMLDEMLGESYADLEIDYEKEGILYYESLAGVIVKYDKNGKFVSEYVENTEYNDGFTDLLELDSCEVMAVGFTGDEDTRDRSLGSSFKDENLGYTSNKCIRSIPNARIALLSNDLELEWSKDYKGYATDFLFGIDSLNDGEFVAVGGYDSEDLFTTDSNDELADALIVKVKISYEITTNDSKFGKVETANQNGKSDVVYKGETAVITTSPDKGYLVDNVIVVDSKGKAVPVTKGEDGTYTYPIYDDTWVTVTFKEIPPIPENPKTGVSTYLSILLLVLALAGMIYYSIREKSLFKRI